MAVLPLKSGASSIGGQNLEGGQVQGTTTPKPLTAAEIAAAKGVIGAATVVAPTTAAEKAANMAAQAPAPQHIDVVTGQPSPVVTHNVDNTYSVAGSTTKYSTLAAANEASATAVGLRPTGVAAVTATIPTLPPGPAVDTAADTTLKQMVASLQDPKTGVTLASINLYLQNNPLAARGAYGGWVQQQVSTAYQTAYSLNGKEQFEALQKLGQLDSATVYISDTTSPQGYQTMSKSIWDQLPKNIQVAFQSGWTQGQSALNAYNNQVEQQQAALNTIKLATAGNVKNAKGDVDLTNVTPDPEKYVLAGLNAGGSVQNILKTLTTAGYDQKTAGQLISQAQISVALSSKGYATLTPTNAVAAGITRQQWVNAGLDGVSYDKAYSWTHMSDQQQFNALTDPKSSFYDPTFSTQVPKGAAFAGKTADGKFQFNVPAAASAVTTTPTISNSLAKYVVGQDSYDVQKFIQDNPTQASVQALKDAGFDTATIAAAQAYVGNATAAALSAIPAVLSGNKTLSGTLSALTDAISNAGYYKPGLNGSYIDPKLNLWVDSRGNVLTDQDIAKMQWNNLTDTQKQQVAGIYSSDLYKGNYFAEAVKQLGEVSSQAGIVGQLVYSPILPILQPIAKASTGQVVSGIEIATGVAVAALDALGLGVLDTLSLTPTAAKIISTAIMGGAAGVFAPSTVKTLTNPSVPVSEKALAVAGELGLILGVGAQFVKMPNVAVGTGTSAIPITDNVTILPKVSEIASKTTDIVDRGMTKVDVLSDAHSALSGLKSKIALVTDLVNSNADSMRISNAITDVSNSIDVLKTSLPDTAKNVGDLWSNMPELPTQVAAGFKVVKATTADVSSSNAPKGSYAVVYKGLSLGDKPIFGISKGRLVVGASKIEFPPLADWNLPKVNEDVHNLTVEPRTNLDNAVWINTKALVKAGMSEDSAKAFTDKINFTRSQIKQFYGLKSRDMVPENMLNAIKYLTADEVRVVLKDLVSSKLIERVYGSATMPPQLRSEILENWYKVFERKPGDIDADFFDGVTPEQGAELIKGTANRLHSTNSRISYDPSKPLQIQIKDLETGVTEKTFEAHIPGEEPSLSGVPEVQEQVYGFSKTSPTVKVDVPGVGTINIARLSETGVGKAEQVLAWRIDPETGEIVTSASPARAKDYPDFYSIDWEYNGKAAADAWLEKFPEAKTVIDKYASDLKDVAERKQSIEDFESTWGKPEKTSWSLNPSKDANVGSVGRYVPVVSILSPGMILASTSLVPIGITSTGSIIAAPSVSAIDIPSASTPSPSVISVEPSISSGSVSAGSVSESAKSTIPEASTISVGKSVLPSSKSVSPSSGSVSPSGSVSSPSTLKSPSPPSSLPPSQISSSLPSSPPSSSPPLPSKSTSTSTSPSVSSVAKSSTTRISVPFSATADPAAREAKRKAFKGSVGWKQGRVIWALKYPFKTQEDVAAFSVDHPPKDFTMVKGGPKSAYTSIQQMYPGAIPEKLTIKVGAVEAILEGPEKSPGKVGAIRFQNVLHKNVSTDIDVKGTKLQGGKLFNEVVVEKVPVKEAISPAEEQLKRENAAMRQELEVQKAQTPEARMKRTMRKASDLISGASVMRML